MGVLAAITLSACMCYTILLAPATTFAAAARNLGRSSCGGTWSAHLADVSPTTGASIWLNHTRGPAGTSLFISGAGWPANTAITIDAYGNDNLGHSWLGQKAIAQTTTGADGALQTAPFAAPTNQACGQGAQYGQPGSFVVFKAHTSDNRESAQARFIYLAIPSLSSSGFMSVMPGSLIQLLGQNWEPGEQVTVTTVETYGQSQEELENTSAGTVSQEPIMQVKSNGHGTFTAEMVVPNDFPLYDYSGLVVTASAISSTYGSFTATPLVFNVLPEAVPTFTANLTQALPGTLVIVSGTHWPMGTVLVEYCRGQTPRYGSSQIGCDPIASQGIGFALIQGPGSFSIEVTIPLNARPGPITLQARADSDILTDIYTQALPLTVLTPAPPQPASWEVVHPRLAQVLYVGEVVLPLTLLIGGGGWALVFWQRQRHRRGRVEQAGNG